MAYTLAQVGLVMATPVWLYILVYVSSRAWFNAKYKAFDSYTRRAGMPPGDR